MSLDETHPAPASTAEAGPKVPATFSEIDKALKKGVIHRNAAARYKSRLAKKAAAATAK